MNWLTNFVRPKIRDVLKKRDTPENLWHKCRNCGQMIFHKDFKEALSVCGTCGHHERINSTDRFGQLFDGGVFTRVKVPKAIEDPLKFKDQKKYADRLKAARSDTGADDAMDVACGKLGGHTTVIAVQNFFFMAGSMGVGVGEALVTAARKAVKSKAPLIVFTAAGGARMQEGILSLMQMPRSTVAVEMVRAAGLPYIVVLTDPTTGGVTASYAMLGDIQIAEPGALIGFAGPRVIENTIREKLPEGFQRAEYLLDHGMVDMVLERKDLRLTLIRIIDIIGRKVSNAPRLTAARSS
ncbi:acetyl-CoA carboxylase, carboxyltransferase subunit beta [Govanella unica]|uniref:Acetyl-coenzyme A carboxylase carboxyl transferase subunit beta n=1 Tax=Govanella unica TaxID=2975056 RepID=A0A9X3TZF3_9PROT|nr:acetyl-CoA carboxylase, carboxyltransferase subunit beta [Govania unica]MDA5194579.1 acetyl-CoA carboxylase, carboxyltransferase subunit beta [Govania unica]